MQWVDIPFPPRIALGAQRRPRWNTTIVQVQSGRESSNQNWSRVRHQFDVSLAVRTASDYDEVVQHFHSVRGRAKAFPFRDAVDYRVEASRGILLDDYDSPTTAYQLAKTYGTGADRYDRRITRPKGGTVAVYRLRGATTTDITSSCTISTTTGLVSITGGVVIGGDVLSWSGQFYVPCRYDTDELPSIVVNRNPGAAGELLVQCDSIPIVEIRE